MVRNIYNHNLNNKHDKDFFFFFQGLNVIFNKKMRKGQKMKKNDGNDTKKINGHI